MENVKLIFRIQNQGEPNWCWLAIGTSCAIAYGNKSDLTQCKLAQMCFGRICCAESIEDEPCQKDVGEKCKNSGANSNYPGYLLTSEILTGYPAIYDAHKKPNIGAFDAVNISKGLGQKEIEFEELKQEINSGCLVAFKLTPRSLLIQSHFVVVSGYSVIDGVNKVYVQDPDSAIKETKEFLHFINDHNGYKVEKVYKTQGTNTLIKENVIPSRLFSLDSNGVRKFCNWTLPITEDRVWPYVVYNADWDKILEDKNLDKAYPVENGYFLKSLFNLISSDETIIEKDNHSNNVRSGRMVKEHRLLLNKYKNSSDIRGLAHCLLKLDFLKIYAIWFRAEDRNSDIYIPLKPNFYGLKSGQIYKSNDFLPYVIKAAKEVDALNKQLSSKKN